MKRSLEKKHYRKIAQRKYKFQKSSLPEKRLLIYEELAELFTAQYEINHMEFKKCDQ